jgi:hypothetical protein
MAAESTLFLCAGLQSSGTTLVSWCFLQRADTDGVLDSDNDLLPKIDSNLGRPHTWYKTTLSCFRLSELAQHYADDGWRVRPLLVVRDLRDVWASLSGKRYSRNGITAEDPPLRLRLRRFVADWELFCSKNWPLLRYESLIAEPEATLRQTCEQLALPWDEAMLTWPKQPSDIADAQWGNDTFWATRGANLIEAVSRYAGRRASRVIAAADLQWLDSEFREFNAANGYPATIEHREPGGPQPCSYPSFEESRRYRWENKQKPIRRLLAWLGIPNQRLIRQRGFKGRVS